MTELAGRRVVVTGATGGVGAALSRRLAHAGARLALTSATPDKLATLAGALRDGTGADVVHRAADITTEAEVAAFFTAAGRHLGGADALVNLAGLSVVGTTWETTTDAYRRVVDVNVTGTFLACKHFVPLVDPSKGGLVVNVSSMAAKRPNPTAPLYCTAKAAVSMFSQAFALQSRERGIRVSTLSPGGIDTPFWGDRPVDRSGFLTADEVAEMIAFVLALPAHIAVHDLAFESVGRRREVAAA